MTSALTVIIGSWLALNLALATALMLRRSRPKMRERLFRWVVGDRERREPRLPRAQLRIFFRRASVPI